MFDLKLPLRMLHMGLLISGLTAIAFANVKPLPVVLDTDIGSDIDDTWALAYLLKCPELDLKMVLTGTGNTTYRAKVAAKLLETAGRADVPVAIGIHEGEWNQFQEPWVEDYDLNEYSGTVFENGVDAFIELVKASDEPIHLIAIGPVPNIEAALKKAPEIASNIRFFGMHGSIDRGYGHDEFSVPAAEANVKSDVEAFRAVLAAEFLHFEITPLDTCGVVSIDGENYQQLRDSNDPVLKAVFENYGYWSERVTWMDVSDEFMETQTSTLFDIVAVYMAYDHSLLDFETLPIFVTDDGYTVRDPDGKSISAAMDWNQLERFTDQITNRLLGKK